MFAPGSFELVLLLFCSFCFLLQVAHHAGEAAAEAMEQVGAVVEGYYAAKSACELARKAGVEMPICRCAYEVLYHGKQAREVVGELMGRAKKDELLERTWM